ncbi:MAG: hypothetical protein QMD13_04900 [Candidatus Bathyarchaeia archaeon]|nr:hypothetical protein [Candidatus Bathyarchaeia archaeon]
MAYWSHITLDLYEFKIAHIAEKLKTKKKEVAKAVKKLKRLRIIDACDSTADSTLEERMYKLCEQYAKLKNPPLTFFYR